MPANLTPQYYAAEDAYKNAVTVKEKIAALEEMLAVIPKHKGTEKLQADLKKRLSKLRQEGSAKSSASRFDPFHIEKEGAGQIALLGFPNSGKSALVGRLSRARVKIADYPFTTTAPIAGMMPYENVLIQLVDTPPISDEITPPGLSGLLRNAHLVMIVIDAGSDDCLEHLGKVLDYMKEKRLSDKRCAIVANRFDLAVDEEIIDMIRDAAPPGVEVIATSAETGHNLEYLRWYLFELLGVVRIYTKAPGREPDKKAPFIMPRGSTVVDLAESIHKDLARRIKNVRVWGSTRFPGQPVPREYELSDEDIVEINQ
ncbi:MAG: TGS domain-containing protein [Firmicutes bacterium]|nr:TGS domain-containing protein [Bacillota bacterium]